MDEADSAEKYMELAMRASLAARAVVKTQPPRGICYNCDETLDKSEKKTIVDGKEVVTLVDEKLFCDIYCSQDWDSRQKRKI